MVSNVSFNGGGYNLGKYSPDIENVAKYTLGTTLVAQQENPFDGMLPMIGLTGLMGIPSVVKWVKDARQNGFGKALAKEAEVPKNIFTAAKDAIKSGEWKNPETYKSVWRNYSIDVTEKAIPEGAKLAKLNTATQDLYTNVMEHTIAAKELAKTPEEAAQELKTANKFLAEANLAAHGQIEAKGIGKVGEFLGKWTGLSSLSKWAKGLAVESPAVRNILKFGKGNGVFALITGGIALFTQVIPAFGLGADKGIKQLGKSIVKTAASVGGWAAGAAIGAAIGSVIPGAGTLVGGAIGALIGIVGGCLGSWAADKAAEAIVGKDELEIAQEEKAKEISQEAIKDPQVAQQLLAAAQEKLKSEDPNSEDAKIAQKSIEHLTQIVQAQSQQSGSQAQFNPSMTGINPIAFNNPLSSNPFGNQQDWKDRNLLAYNAG